VRPEPGADFTVGGSGEDAAVNDLPADVRERYRKLARQRKWPSVTDRPLDPDGWRLRAVDRGIFYGSGTAIICLHG
jgi:hypothetical protein